MMTPAILLALTVTSAAWDYDGFAKNPYQEPATVAPARIVKPTTVVPVTPPPPAERKPTAAPAPKAAPRAPAPKTWEGEDCTGKTWKHESREELIRFLDARNRAIRANARPPVQVYFPPVRQPLPPQYTLQQQPMFSTPSFLGGGCSGGVCR